MLGWMLIGTLTVAIQVNLIVLTIQAYQHTKLLLARKAWRKEMLAKKSQVAPIENRQENQSVKAADMAVYDPSRLDSEADQSNAQKKPQHVSLLMIEEEEEP